MTSINLNSSHVNPYKTLSTHSQPQVKSLASSQGEDPALAQWVEENRYVYDGIMNGTSDLSQADKAEFMEWWNWAMGEMQGAGSTWGEELSLESDPLAQEGGVENGPAPDPFGAQPGSMGNLVFTEEEVRVGFINEARPYDVWAKNFILDVSSTAAFVNVEKTVDTRFQPPEDVVKITVKDKATGMESVYFLHDVDSNTKIKINTPGAENVTDRTNTVTVGNYKKPTEADANALPEASHPIETLEDGTLLVEAPIGETIELTPTAGENQKWEIWGDFNMTLRPSDKVVVSKNDDGTYKVVVTHRDESMDEYTIHGKGNIKATPENATIPAEITEITLNKDTGEAAEVKGDANFETDDATGNRTWDGEANYDIYTRGDGKVNEIYAREKVSLHVSSNKEFWKVTYDETTKQYKVEVYDNLAHTGTALETFIIDGSVKEIVLDGPEGHIDTTGVSADAMEKISVVGMEGEIAPGGLSFPTREEFLANSPSYITSRVEYQEILTAIDNAMKTGDWTLVKNQLNGIGEDYVNDVVRSLVTALSNFVGGDYVKLKEMLNKIPVDVRETMISRVRAQNADGVFDTYSELGEKHEGEIWNSQETSNVINNSLET